MLAVAGLGVDVGWWYTIKRQNQSAADAAAVSAAWEVKAGKTSVSTNLVPAAKAAANQNEASQYQISTLNGVSSPCTDPGGSYVCYQYSDSIISSGVLVVLRQQQTGWLSKFGSLANLTIANRAVAAVVTLAPSCMYLMNPSGIDLDIQGSGSLTMPTCAICADSTATNSINVQGSNNAVLTAEALITAGGIATTGSPQITTTLPTQTGAAPCPDPYAGTLTHSFLTSGMPTNASPNNCTSSSNSTNNTTTYSSPNGNACTISGSIKPPSNSGTVFLPGNVRISGGLTIKNDIVNLAPGTYWITDGDLALQSNGTLECTTCVPGGAGVTIILTTGQSSGGSIGSVTEQSNPTIDNLNAPGSGTDQNLLLIQDSNGLPTGTTPPSSSGSTFQGTEVNGTLNGLIYFPDQPLSFQGNPSATASCLIVVAGSLTLAGNSSMAASGCPTSGPGTVQQLQTVALVE
jgi:hypothetical protein